MMNDKTPVTRICKEVPKSIRKRQRPRRKIGKRLDEVPHEKEYPNGQ